MARSRVDDLLQAHSFWLFDIVPTLQYPFVCFDASLGFSSCSAPEVSLDMEEIVDGNYPWKRKAAGKAAVSTISLSRGARFWDGDFWAWISDALNGKTSPRKTIGLLHLHRVGKGIAPDAMYLAPHEAGYATGKAWVLFGCLPSRYKAGSDFDANDASVSIAELDFDCERIEEIKMAT